MPTRVVGHVASGFPARIPVWMLLPLLEQTWRVRWALAENFPEISAIAAMAVSRTSLQEISAEGAAVLR